MVALYGDYAVVVVKGERVGLARAFPGELDWLAWLELELSVFAFLVDSSSTRLHDHS